MKCSSLQSVVIAISMLLGTFMVNANPACIDIESAPHVINKSGCYNLSGDLSIKDESSNAIQVNANDVHINLNNRVIRGANTSRVSNAGIFAQGVTNLTISNGRITGFLYAIRVDRGSVTSPARKISIKNINAFDNTFRGIYLNADEVIVSENQIVKTGGSTFFPDSFSIGIEVTGSQCHIVNNKIFDTYAVGIGEGVAISLTDNAVGCFVSKNKIFNKFRRAGARTFGIWVGGQDRRATISNNEISGFTFAYAYAYDYPRLRHVFKSNVATNIDCTPSNSANYYKLLDSTNIFHNGTKECSDTIKARRAQVKTLSNTRSIFRLAQAYYSAHEFLDMPCKRLGSMEQAVPLFEEAAQGGLEEARRVLPGVRSAVADMRKQTASVCRLSRQ
jgi:hypothetical protein